MNPNNETAYVTEPAAITKLAAAVFAGDNAAGSGRATYLRSLLAAVQISLAGKPVHRVTGRARRSELDAAVAAIESANTAFYNAVLAAVPEGLNAQERQSKTSFARSASATLRRAIKLGWNPLATGVGAVTKGALTAWIKEHREPVKLNPAQAEKRVERLLERIGQLVGGLPKDEAKRILATAAEELAPETAPQRIRHMRLTERPRAAAH